METKRVFIVDDDRNSVVAVKEILQEAGFEVHFAFDGKECFDKINEVMPDVILLDLVLPDQSGFKIAQGIKSMPKFSQVPIIAISLKKEDIDKHIAAKSGIVGYIEKPIDSKALLYNIKEILPLQNI